jgi:hypothetical protein
MSFMESQIIESQLSQDAWLSQMGQPVASRLLLWEQQQADELLADVFGYHAVQLGWPQLQALRSNRMPHRWQACAEFEWPNISLESPAAMESLDGESSPTPQNLASAEGPDLWLDSRAWPWQADSLDLVVLPHTLERSADPHACLREVERVLIPEGQVLITGLNPMSLWGWKGSSLIGYRRLRDWLRLLGFEVQVSRFGGWTPALGSERWMQRLSWMDTVGQRWCPILGGVYLLMATKRVPGGRLIEGRRWRAVRSPAAATAPIARSESLIGRDSAPKDRLESR